MGRIKVIVAASTNNVIGVNNDLPWHLPSDMKMFKEVTAGSIVVMGRKCWESIPVKYRPLPGRLNIVLTRNSEYKADGAEVYNSLFHVIRKYSTDDRDIFIIGGAQIYSIAFGLADTVHLTRVHTEIDGDVKLDGFVDSEWEVTKDGEMQEENGYKFNFQVLKPKHSLRVAIIGGRDFKDYDLVKLTMSPYINKVSTMVSGAALGADKLGEKWADEYGIPKLIFEPEWEKHGKAAGFIRNKTIVANSDLVVCFWDGASKGTANSIQHAHDLNKNLLIIRY